MRMIWVQGQYGLGDNVYQRPFIRAALARFAKVYITTSWPEMYEDLAGPERLRFVEPATRLRTQAKNVARQDGTLWSKPPEDRRVPPQMCTVRMGYTHQDLIAGNIVQAHERKIPLCGEPYVFDLPPTPPREALPWDASKPYAFLRPATERKEWLASARSPRTEYVAEAAAILRDRGCTVVSVADVDPPAEWLVEPAPIADVVLHRGELDVRHLMTAMRHAAVVVGGVGFIVPMGIAAGVPCVFIGGGLGAHNAPEVVTDPRMDLESVRFILPNRYCRCAQMQHTCDKTISDFAEKFDEALIGASLRHVSQALTKMSEAASPRC